MHGFLRYQETTSLFIAIVSKCLVCDISSSSVGKINHSVLLLLRTSPDGALAMSLPNGRVDTGFTSQYWLQPKAGFF